MPQNFLTFQQWLEDQKQACVSCPYYQSDTSLNQLSNIELVQEQLIKAMDILSLLVDAGENKKVRIASNTLNTDDIAITVLHLVCLVKKLNELPTDYDCVYHQP